MADFAQEQLLDFAPGDELAGFRLHRFEVYNWGTFNERVWTLAPRGENALLTGDIGSGKSTLVDALTTLLVPQQRIRYNKAAGAGAGERSLRSYVLGHYKAERGEPGLAARSVALRDANTYSVILSHFFNEGYGQHVTLAQIFWMRGAQGQPARLYVVADRPLTIAEDFAGFGTDINNLRKQLRKQPHLELHDTFPPYGSSFRRRFGIGTPQALDLFNQTVSMKSVGNLTDFVRDHMLEPFPVEARIQALIGHFDDLDRAHQAVLDAKARIDVLRPLIADADRYDERLANREVLRDCREALQPWFASLKSCLLRRRLEQLEGERERTSMRVDRLEERRHVLRNQRDEINRDISENGGDRLAGR